MYTKSILLAFVGSAAAFNAPMMTGRREAIAGAAGAAVVAPLLRPTSAEAKDAFLRTPFIEIFDERDGCKGPARNKADDRTFPGMCVKVQMRPVTMDRELAKSVITTYGGKAQ
eukprot:CAMPEP_0173390470 /NCGR_PEP_ID=MMETSP1356-20130122/14973_1 /TAXON_ID=77927 ORGANISM="Hemiselmis virescens, Strain PCC157" /NCGR_SAMPLE_ID=MMETSP1356 /ASSEMBLY_ACC=CAM_ASM_000847 /LENGTH=112 /DNA_ID=CAMNT_0014347871 /DNA_START=26 /DNA_END=364 /DNA_ORIENTATION=+